MHLAYGVPSLGRQVKGGKKKGKGKNGVGHVLKKNIKGKVPTTKKGAL